MAGDAPEAKAPRGLEGHLVSRCGVLCETCPAYRQGVCPGCPHLEPGECPVRDCADRLAGGQCGECAQPSCYHFEALAARREAMRLSARRRRLLMAREGPPAGSPHAVAGVRGTGRGGSLTGMACTACALRCGARTAAPLG